jgi:hypothetical protein
MQILKEIEYSNAYIQPMICYYILDMNVWLYFQNLS